MPQTREPNKTGFLCWESSDLHGRGPVVPSRGHVHREPESVRRLFLVLLVLPCFSACGGGPAVPAVPGRSVRIELENVVVRQYHDGRERFEMRAGSLELDERGHKLVARGGVRGRLQPGMWEEKK